MQEADPGHGLPLPQGESEMLAALRTACPWVARSERHTLVTTRPNVKGDHRPITSRLPAATTPASVSSVK
jgi:hypothetical protein